MSDIYIKDLCAGWGKKEVLHGLSAEVKSGSFTVILGKNGCGKSTLVATLCGVIGYKGEILCNGRDIRSLSSKDRAKLISVVPQIPHRASIKVEDLVAFGRLPYLKTGEKLSSVDKAAIEKAITELELEDIRYSDVDRISGGELRRAYIAMALAQDAPVTVLDEPTAHMDEKNRVRILQILKRLNREQGKTMLIVLHSISDAVKYADEIILMDKGEKVIQGSVNEILEGKYIENIFGVERYTGEVWGIKDGKGE